MLLVQKVVLKVIKEYLELMGLMVAKVIKVFKEIKDYKVIKDYKEIKETQALRLRMEHTQVTL